MPLSLTRKAKQRTYIDVPAGSARRIEVLVSRIRHGSVQLGFVADKDVRIIREEAEQQERGAA